VPPAPSQVPHDGAALGGQGEPAVPEQSLDVFSRVLQSRPFAPPAEERVGIPPTASKKGAKEATPPRATFRRVVPKSLRVTGDAGVELHVLEWSEPGVPLLFVHGFGNEAHIWDDIAPALAPYYRTLALDLRGHGDSARDPERRYGDSHLVGDLESVADALGISRWVLIGHSLGGRLVMRYAGRHPERVAGFVVIDSGPEHDRRGSVRIRLESQRALKEGGYPSREAYRAEVARNYPAAPAHVIDRLAAHGVREAPGGGFEAKLDPDFMAGRRDAAGSTETQTKRELWDALARIECPSLVIRGAASDVLSQDVADRMAEVLPQGRLCVVPRASHSVMSDNLEACLRAITDFALSDQA